MKTTTHTMKTITAITVVSFLVMNCSPSSRKNHVIAIDNSVSVSESLVQGYLKTVEDDIIGKMGGQDRLTVLLVDGCSQTQAERVFELDLSTQEFNNANDGLNHAKDSVNARKARFIKNKLHECRRIIAAKRALRSQCRYFTDILSTLMETSKLANANTNFSSTFEKVLNDIVGKENYQYQTVLYLFSDMLHTDMTGQTFKTFAWKQTTDVEKQLGQLQLTNKVASLPNVDVFVCGATSSIDAGSLAGKQIANVSHFWNLYFKAAGANLKAYGYDVRSEIARYQNQ